MRKKYFYSLLDSDSTKNNFSIEDYNIKRNIELQENLSSLKFDKIIELNNLFEQYIQNKKEKNGLLLKIILTKIETNTFNIKGILHNYQVNNSTLRVYSPFLLNLNKYDIAFELNKLTQNKNNKLLYFNIIISNINEESYKYINNILNNYKNQNILFINLKAELKSDFKNNIYLLFKNTYKTKIYIENQELRDSRCKEYIDILKLNEFAYINYINSNKLFSEIKNNIIKNENYVIDIDLKKYLEIETESSYIDYLKEEYCHDIVLNNRNINICCFVKNIYENKDKKVINVILENLFDLNYIILEIPIFSKFLENLYVNCIYIFFNLILFIDEKFNIKFSIHKNDNIVTKKILLYYLSDSNKYNNKKINDLLYNSKYDQLCSVIKYKKIIRTIQKYLVIIEQIFFINLYCSNNIINNYEGLILCSDGTSQGILYIKGNNISEIKKFQIDVNIKYYFNIKKKLDGKITIKPKLYETIQLIIIGHPILGYNLNLSFAEFYESIKDLNQKYNINNFDLLATKNEFTLINGTFTNNSESLKEIPMIKVLKIFSLEEYSNLKKQINNNKNNSI